MRKFLSLLVLPVIIGISLLAVGCGGGKSLSLPAGTYTAEYGMIGKTKVLTTSTESEIEAALLANNPWMAEYKGVPEEGMNEATFNYMDWTVRFLAWKLVINRDDTFVYTEAEGRIEYGSDYYTSFKQYSKMIGEFKFNKNVLSRRKEFKTGQFEKYVKVEIFFKFVPAADNGGQQTGEFDLYERWGFGETFYDHFEVNGIWYKTFRIWDNPSPHAATLVYSDGFGDTEENFPTVGLKYNPETGIYTGLTNYNAIRFECSFDENAGLTFRLYQNMFSNTQGDLIFETVLTRHQ